MEMKQKITFIVLLFIGMIVFRSFPQGRSLGEIDILAAVIAGFMALFEERDDD